MIYLDNWQYFLVPLKFHHCLIWFHQPWHFFHSERSSVKSFHCSLLVGSFWKKLMQKLLCASLSLLLTKFLRRLNSLNVSLSGFFFHLLNKKCFWAIECFNSCVNQSLELWNFLPFFNSLNWWVFFNNFLKNIDEWIKHIVAILTLVHSTPFGEGKISVKFKAWE